MTAQLPARIRAWLMDTFTFEAPAQAADAVADGTRWGWLAALSGVAVEADYAREQHLETLAQPSRLSA